MTQTKSLIDSVHIRIHKSLISDQQLGKLLNTIDITHSFESHEYGNVCKKGRHKNFQVAINMNTVCVNGSLPKFYSGSNIENITFDEVTEALKQLAFELGIPVLRGDIARLDIAQCIPLENDLRYYFKDLLDTPDYERDRSTNGVRYTKSNLVLAFYNKNDDVIMNPDAFLKYRDQHLMRIELRIMDRVRRTLMKNSKKLMAVQLFSSTFQNKLTEYWWKHYTAILKRRVILEHGDMKGWKDSKQYLMATALHQLTMTSWFDLVEIFASENNWESKVKSDVKASSRKVWENNKITTPNQYIRELEEKIEQMRRSRT